MNQIEKPWALESNQVLEKLESNLVQGLSEKEVVSRLSKFGSNVLETKKEISFFKKLLNQFESPVVITLIIATIISLALGDTIDAIAIMFIVVLNAGIGLFQELKAESAVKALKNLSAPRARVIRNGSTTQINSSEVVPGDILFLEAGDYIPADARLIHESQLSIDESVLTGESLPVRKTVQLLGHETVLADRKNMIFAGTAVSNGTAKAIVTATGQKTEVGHIAALLDSAELKETPLQRRLAQVSSKLLWACAGVIGLVIVLGIYHNENKIDVLMSAVSLAVAAIPEGLPTVVSLALALAVRRMTKKNAIVKHLPAVETLGSTSVICTDKTGTLTTGKMKVRELFTLSKGLFPVDPKNQATQTEIELLKASVLASNADINHDVSTGDMTEVALLFAATDLNQNFKDWQKDSQRLAEWSFDSDRKRMSVATKENDSVFVYCKGAPEAVIDICNLSSIDKSKINKMLESLSGQGRRLLAVGYKKVEGPSISANLNFREVEKDLEFLGLISIADPPRKESIEAISHCRAAGIKVVMITGDHPVTAKAIAKELGLVTEEKMQKVLTGLELDKFSEEDLVKQVESIVVYARVSPEHKLRIIRAWQRLGHTVAMTGDGVNDAPALKQASIGVSMGKGGTEVARQASSMILTDDNFATIVSAVEEGRAIYGNIRRTIQYLLSGNLSEILIMLGAAVWGWPAPLAPIHLLWINLVTDGLPSLALAAEPVPKNYLKSSYRPSSENFFNRDFYKEMIFVGCVSALMTLIVYGYFLKVADEATARSYAFSFLVFTELFRSFACRSEKLTFFEMGLFSNLYHLVAVAIPMGFQLLLHHSTLFQEVFKVKPLSWTHCSVLILLTLIPVSLVEVRKMFLKKNARFV